MADPYEILGVARNATEDEIKRAYRRLAKELHPDARPGDAEAAERFKAATAAYDLLTDPQRKAAQDGTGGRGRHPWEEEDVGSGDDAIGERPIDLFGDIAGNRRGRVFGAASTSLYLPGEDLAETLRISAEEAETGTVRTLELVTGARVEVTVAPGTGTGRTLTFEGLGLPGIGGGPPGDLNVVVEILPPPRLDRRRPAGPGAAP